MRLTRIGIAILLAAMIPALLFASAQSEGGESGERVLPNMEGTRIVDEPVTLRIMNRLAPDQPAADALPFFQYLEDVTGLDLQFEAYKGEDTGYYQQVNLVFASGDLPDIVYDSVQRPFIINQADIGTIVPLNDLIDEYTVNISAFLAERPEIRREITDLDGNIYGLFLLNEIEDRLYDDPYFINQEWLDRLGLEMPQTTDEFREVLLAFKNQDANGNGDPSDELPFSWREAGWQGQRIDGFFGSWGVLSNADDNHLMVKNDEVVFAAAEQGYRDGLEYLTALYTDGLIDPESFVQDMTQLRAKGEAGQVGALVFFYPHNVFGAEGVEAYSFLPPLAGPDGTRLAQQTAAVSGLEQGKFLITRDNPYPEVSIRLADVLMDGGEMSLNAMYGPKGEYWRWNANDKWILDDSGFPEGMGEVQIRNSLTSVTQVSIRDAALYDQAVLGERFVLRQQWLDQVRAYFPEDVLPDFWFDAETANEVASIASELNSFVAEMRARFILQGVDDAGWREYLQDLRQIGSERLVAIYQNAYDRVD
jgi:putative aldouronate transport system substrate-binding protein